MLAGLRRYHLRNPYGGAKSPRAYHLRNPCHRTILSQFYRIFPYKILLADAESLKKIPHAAGSGPVPGGIGISQHGTPPKQTRSLTRIHIMVWTTLSSLCQISSQTPQNYALGMKSCHDMRSIDQGMESELAAPEPKWGVATRVACDTHSL